MSRRAALVSSLIVRRRLLLDLASSYGVSVVRVLANAAVLAVLYRHTTPSWVAAYVLMRSSLGLINNLTAGLAPAALAELSRPVPKPAVLAAAAEAEDHGPFLAYAMPPEVEAVPPASRRANSLAISLALLLLFGFAALVYSETFTRLYDTPIVGVGRSVLGSSVLVLAVGLLGRALSENAGAAIQWRGRLAWDNAIVIAGELLFVASLPFSVDRYFRETFSSIAAAYAVTGALIFVLRWLLAAGGQEDGDRVARLDGSILARLASTAFVISLGSFADFLYAPTNTLLIGHYLGSETLAAYAPLLQIDAGLLLLIAAIAPVLLPRVSAAMAVGDVARVRRLYLQSMLVGVGVLACGALAVIAAGRPLLKLWIGEAPPLTLQLLPLVLVHTVVGGSAGIGRATLLGMNRFHAYTISALVGGVANVALALLFVAGFGWGVRGIVFATILSVVGRCAVWMPWHILRALSSATPARSVAAV